MKNHILAFLPVMKELEAMSINPVRLMFSTNLPTIDEIEKCYVAISRARIKYPEWYKVMAEGINNWMKPKSERR